MLGGEQSGLQTRIAATESVSLCTRIRGIKRLCNSCASARKRAYFAVSITTFTRRIKRDWRFYCRGPTQRNAIAARMSVCRSNRCACSYYRF